jgi:hypothetical protein
MLMHLWHAFVTMKFLEGEKAKKIIEQQLKETKKNLTCDNVSCIVIRNFLAPLSVTSLVTSTILWFQNFGDFLFKNLAIFNFFFMRRENFHNFPIKKKSPQCKNSPQKITRVTRHW